MGIINDTLNLLQGKGGTTTMDQLNQLSEGVASLSLPGQMAKIVRDLIEGNGIGIIGSEGMGRRASGGPVAGGSSYLVGEMGPEIFTPAAGGGHITPNKSLGGSNITINVNAGMGANGSQIGEQIVTAIKRFERTSGPVFASA
jgi:hypothetical protein